VDGPIHQELVVVVEEYVVLVLVNDIHGTEDVECVVYAPLDVLKVDSLAFLCTHKSSIIIQGRYLINFIVDSVIR